MKEEVRASWQKVSICGGESCSKDSKKIIVDAGMTDGQIKSALAGVKHMKVLEVTEGMAMGFGSFESKETFHAFERRLKVLLGLVICFRSPCFIYLHMLVASNRVL